MLGHSYQTLHEQLPQSTKSSFTHSQAAFGGLSGTAGIRHRALVKSAVATTELAVHPSPQPRTDLHRDRDGDAVEVLVTPPAEKASKSQVASAKPQQWFLDFKPQSAAPKFTDELAKWTAVNALVGNLMSSTLNYFAPRALPAVAQALGGPGTFAMSVFGPIILGVIKTAIVMRCKAQSGEDIDTRLDKALRQQLETEQKKLQNNYRNQWIGAWLGNAIPDLIVNIIAVAGKQELAEKLMSVIQPNLAPIVKAAVGFGIATKLATEEPNTISIPLNKLKFA